MPSPLEELGGPLVFRIDDPASLGLDSPSTEYERAYRTRLRSLEWMQKEALVTGGETGDTWRLPTDEGPYLDAADVAPPPLGFTTAGLVSCYTNEIQAVAMERGIDVDDLSVALECFYTAEGSALGGTRRAVVLPPELDVRIDADVDERAVRDLVDTAVSTAPVRGAMGDEHTNRFALSLDGRDVTLDGLAEIDGSSRSDPVDAFEAITHDVEDREQLIVRHTGRRTEELPNAEERYAEKLGLDPSEEPGHVIHLRGTCTPRDDGLYHVEQETYSPRASVFEFLAGSPTEHGGQRRAPDGLAYFSAASVFCLTTHLAHYADVKDTELDYRIVQDTHFSAGRSRDEPASAGPVDTHLFVDTADDEAFARDALEIAEQACYVHELWRSAVRPEVTITTGRT